MPNIFTALCLNEAGLNEFKRYDPFEKMFKVLISQEYLQGMLYSLSDCCSNDKFDYNLILFINYKSNQLKMKPIKKAVEVLIVLFLKKILHIDIHF